MSSQPVRLNENQVRHVVAIMKQVDSVLSSVERLAHSASSPFVREVSDLSAEEGKWIHALVDDLRSRMTESLYQLQIPLPPKDRSARWSIEAALRVADVSFSDLGGKRLEGYGDLDPESAAAVARLSLELRRIVEEGIFMLRQHS